MLGATQQKLPRLDKTTGVQQRQLEHGHDRVAVAAIDLVLGQNAEADEISQDEVVLRDEVLE